MVQQQAQAAGSFLAWMTAVEAAALIGCSARMARKHAASGRIQAFRFGKSWALRRRPAV
jgi:excisionase family DNA binding protein